MKSHICKIFVVALVLLIIFCSFAGCSNKKEQIVLNNNSPVIDATEQDDQSQSYGDETINIAKDGKEDIIGEIENLFDYADSEEERFEYSFLNYYSGKAKDGVAVLHFSLLMANVSGKAILVRNFSEYIPSLSIVPEDDEDICVAGEVKSTSREFNRYEYVRGEFGSESLSIADTGIWMDREAVAVSFVLSVPEDILNSDFNIVVEFRNVKTVIADSSFEEQNFEDAEVFGDKVDVFFMRPTPVGDQGVVRVLLVNRENHLVAYKYSCEAEIAYYEDGEKIVRQLDYVHCADLGKTLRQNEAAREDYWYYEESAFPLKTGVYTINVMNNGVTIGSFQYLVIDQNTRNNLIGK